MDGLNGQRLPFGSKFENWYRSEWSSPRKGNVVYLAISVDIATNRNK